MRVCALRQFGSMTERRLSDEHVLATVIESGPLTFQEIRDELYPEGMTTSRKDLGAPTRARNPKRLRDRVDKLVAERRLTPDVEGHHALGPVSGTVMVIYLGRAKRYVAVFDAAGNRLDHSTVPQKAEVRSQDLPGLIRGSIRQLAFMMRRGAWCDSGPPRAMAVGLPAALDPGGSRVVSADPRGWDGLPDLKAAIVERWESERQMRQGRSELPKFPVADTAEAPPALTIDSDIVMDTIGAMYERPPTHGQHYPTGADSVMGVKCSGGIRSTLVTRGERLNTNREGRITRRGPGDRRDSVFRGRYGDTVGLGHSIALILRASRDREDVDSTGEDVAAYWDRIQREGHKCSCGTATMPHLEAFASHGAVAKRLEVDPDNLDEIMRRPVRSPTAEPAIDARTREVLSETGRLLGYAVDQGVRLYDPEAVLLTGGVPYSDVVWSAIQEASELPQSVRRSLVRVSDLNTDDIENPIGPRGGARLAADTWIYPALVAHATH